MSDLKIIHTADFHLGAGLREAAASNYTLDIERQKDYLKQLEAISSHALNSGSDFLIIAGDVFHTSRPSGYMLDEFAKFVRSVTLKGTKVVCIPGNHDQPRAVQTEAYVKALADIGAPNFHFFRTPEVCILEGANSRKKVRFIALPYLSPQMIDEPEFTRIIQEKFIQLKSKESSDADYTIVVSHLYIEGAKLGSEQRIATLSDYPLPRSVLLEKDVDFVCLGHIHTPQFLNEKMAYSGSVERVDFGEQDETKDFVTIEEQGGGLEASFADLKCRPLMTMPKSGGFFDLVNEINPEKSLIEAVRGETIPEGAILRVLVRLGPRQTLSTSVLEEIAKEKSILHWFLQYERLAPQRFLKTPDERLAVRDFYIKYLERSLGLRVNRAILDLVKQEGLKIMDEVEAEKAK